MGHADDLVTGIRDILSNTAPVLAAPSAPEVSLPRETVQTTALETAEDIERELTLHRKRAEVRRQLIRETLWKLYKLFGGSEYLREMSILSYELDNLASDTAQWKEHEDECSRLWERLQELPEPSGAD